MGIRCPSCGHDNPDYAFYCGVCSAGLKPQTSGQVHERRMAVSSDAPPARGTSYDDALRKWQKRSWPLLFMSAALMGFMVAISLLFSDRDWVLLGIWLLLAFAYGIEAVRIYRIAHSEERMAHIRLPNWTGMVRSEASGIPVMPLIVIAIIAVFLGVFALAFPGLMDDYGLTLVVFFSGISLLVYGALLTTWTIAIEEGGIVLGPKWSVRAFVPIEELQSISIEKNVLTIDLTDKARRNSGLMMRRKRYLLRGVPVEFRQEVERSSTGVPAHVEPPSQASLEVEHFAGLVNTKADRSNLFIAGLFLILAGAATYVLAAFLFYLENIFGLRTGGAMSCCGSLEMLFGTVAILGGILTIKKSKYSTSMIAGIVATISIGFSGISLGLGLAALYLIHKHRDDFES